MVCKMIKKGVVGAALGAGVLGLLFGTSAPSYVKTTFSKVRQSAKDSVPVGFELDRARQELADLQPAILKCRENVARAEVQVERMGREIAERQRGLGEQLRKVTALRALAENTTQLTSGTATFTQADVKRDLARCFDNFKTAKCIVEDQEKTLKTKQGLVQSAREQLDAMIAAQQALRLKIDSLEAKHQQLEAKQAASEFATFDDSALARVKQTVAEIEERIEVMDKLAQQETRYSETGVSAAVEASRDICKEVDAELNAPKAAPAGEKNL